MSRPSLISFGQAIFEFIATEAAYVRDLQLIVEVKSLECSYTLSGDTERTGPADILCEHAQHIGTERGHRHLCER